MTAVSVILSSYNQREYLDASVRSVLGQTATDWELIVVDNGSTDGSQELLKRYAADPRIRLILHSQNEAVTKRLNQAIAVSRGEFISILYSDDYYLPHKLESQLAQFARLPREVGVVYSPGQRLNVDTGRIWTDSSFSQSGWVLGPLLDALFAGGFISPISPLIRRECFERYPFHEDQFVEGESIFFRFAIGFQFGFHVDPTVVMRDHERNMGRSVKKNIQNWLASVAKLEQDPDFPHEARPQLQAMKLRIFRMAGWQAVRVASDSSWAREMLWHCVAADPREWLHPKTLAGLGLSFLPDVVLDRMNRAILRVRRSAGHTNYVPN
jgi:glycosyltransferase involved in cell wall biosynthesis